MMKHLHIKKGHRALIVAVSAIICLLPALGMAQTSITAINPVAGFAGDEIVLGGEGFTDVDKVLIGEIEASFTVNSDTEVVFTIPEGSSDARVALQVASEAVAETSRVFHVLTKATSTQELLFYETMEDLPAGGGGITGIEDHEAGNHFNNDDITFGGWGGMDYDVQGGSSGYEGASGGFSVQLWGQYATFEIHGLNTDGYDNIRLSFGAAAWWYPGWLGGILIETKSGDGEWVALTTVTNALSTYQHIKVGPKLPAAESLSIRFTNLNEIDYASAFPPNIDDVKITAIPAGVAQIKSFNPGSVRLGKELVINGANMEDIQTVIFSGADDTQIELTEFTRTEGSKISVVVPQAAVDGKVILVNSTGDQFESIDVLTIANSMPTVTAFEPAAGPEGGMIYLIGDNLYNVEKVFFADTESTEFYYVNDTILEVYIPAGAATGAVDVNTAQGDYASDEPVLWDDDDDPETDPVDVSLGSFTVDNTVPKITFTLSATEAEEGQTVDVVAELSAAADQDVSVGFKIGGVNVNTDDYTISEDTLTIAAGSTSSTVAVISITEDTDTFEDVETVEVKMISAIGGAVLGQPRMQTFDITLILSVKDEITQNEIIVYQNANGLNIQLRNMGNMTNTMAMIYDLNGRAKYLNRFDQITDKVTISAANQLQPGVYVLRLGNAEGEFSKKFIIK